MVERPVVGYIEDIKIRGKTIPAKIDTGADVSSIDIGLAAELRLGPIIKKSRIRSPHGKTRRAVISVDFSIVGKETKGSFSLSDRHRLKYKVLIGKNILSQGFIVDSLKEK